ncbi:MAG: prolyl oligopeptidase family serine peptidase [Pseudomonadota bacterium]
MQNDVADATRWAIAQGIADPARICIAGASYGGYATLMGLVNDPDLYKCGIDIVGVTDLTLRSANSICKGTLMALLKNPDLGKCSSDYTGISDLVLQNTNDWNFEGDASEGYKTYGMPALIGDPVTEAARFAATLPLLQAGRIRQPILMGYSGRDTRVLLDHGQRFLDAVKVNNPNVEMVVYNDEAHRWVLTKNKVDFWSRAEIFLDQHIGKK